jgi:hypothetical protein
MRPKRFFVLNCSGRSSLSDPSKPFQVQILDSKGRAKYYDYFGADHLSLVIEGYNVPLPVLEAALRQEVGKGDFVDVNGQSIW